MAQLKRSIFSNAPRWAKCAAINADGTAYWFNVSKDQLTQTDTEHRIQPGVNRQIKYIGQGLDATNWQNSALNRRESKW